MSLNSKLIAAALLASVVFAQDAAAKEKSLVKAETVVLVHGAFADSSSWNAVISNLKRDGYPVIAVANPLRTLKTDADYVTRVIRSIEGPVVLVGHSYGGGVITNVASDLPNVKALVFVAGMAPDSGESAASLGKQFPSGTLGQTLAPPVVQADGSKDLYIDQSKFWAQFAADVPEAEAAQMGAAQRPILEGALNETSGSPSWKGIPSWFIYGSLDKNIPSDLHAFMAKRAAAKETKEIKGASHVVMISHPKEVTAIIEDAAASK